MNNSTASSIPLVSHTVVAGSIIGYPLQGVLGKVELRLADGEYPNRWSGRKASSLIGPVRSCASDAVRLPPYIAGAEAREEVKVNKRRQT